jgi:predicted aspartyl protease
MRIKIVIENIEEWFIIDTGFSGDLIVKSEVFDTIDYVASEG